MDYFIPSVFVVPASNTYPTTGSTDALAAKQFGVYDNTYVPANAGTIASKPGIMFVQGRAENIPGLGSKKVTIRKEDVLQWYKVPSVSTATGQITTVSAFHAACEEDLSITIRAFSNYIETGYFNGLTQTITIPAPCCDCGQSPCTDVDPSALVDRFIAAINANTLINKYIVASRTGSGTGSTLVLTGQVLDKYGNPCVPHAFQYEYDKLRFDVFAYKGAYTTQDYLVSDACTTFATVTKTQTSTYPTGSGDEIWLVEQRYFSLQNLHSQLFMNPAFNDGVVRYSDPTLFYSTYVVIWKDPQYRGLDLAEPEKFGAFIAIPAGQESGFEALVTPYLGTPGSVTVGS